MNYTISILITSLVVVLSWALPVYGVVLNRLEPNYMSAMAVPFAFLAGCVIHFVLLAVWAAIRRSHLSGLEVALLAASVCVMLVLTNLADFGWLSKTTP